MSEPTIITPAQLLLHTGFPFIASDGGPDPTQTTFIFFAPIGYVPSMGEWLHHEDALIEAEEHDEVVAPYTWADLGPLSKERQLIVGPKIWDPDTVRSGYIPGEHGPMGVVHIHDFTAPPDDGGYPRPYENILVNWEGYGYGPMDLRDTLWNVLKSRALPHPDFPILPGLAEAFPECFRPDRAARQHL
jgi:hypothetical protein